MAPDNCFRNSLRPRKRIVIAVLGAALLLASLALVSGGAWFYVAGRAALPPLDGTIRVAGISGQVTIVRDGRGVPHIRAAGLEDLFFAQGYVTAQDRLWQLDVMRRYAGGELAEVLGDSVLAHDRRQRILGLRETARRAFAGLEPRERSFLQAYARGVNAWMAASREHLPLEFRALRYEPRPWLGEDSLMLAAYCEARAGTGIGALPFLLAARPSSGVGSPLGRVTAPAFRSGHPDAE
jgi:penicillin amidase